MIRLMAKTKENNLSCNKLELSLKMNVDLCLYIGVSLGMLKSCMIEIIVIANDYISLYVFLGKEQLKAALQD